MKPYHDYNFYPIRWDDTDELYGYIKMLYGCTKDVMARFLGDVLEESVARDVNFSTTPESIAEAETVIEICDVPVFVLTKQRVKDIELTMRMEKRRHRNAHLRDNPTAMFGL